jgi:hypothetical protein
MLASWLHECNQTSPAEPGVDDGVLNRSTHGPASRALPPTGLFHRISNVVAWIAILCVGNA